ncbi:MAG: hypothetical protein LBS98_07480 [Coriobacteriales bacterium]|nr:hypothetical protein [Coriobacteriales bacterium]
MREEKKGLFAALARLSASEKRYLIALLIVALIGGGGWLVVLPTLTTIQNMEDEIETLNAHKSQYEQQIAKTTAYESQYTKANEEYKQYQQFFFPNMPPEEVDDKVTTLLKEHGLDPKRLSMTALQLDELPAYEAQPLVPGAVPEGEGAAGDATAEGKARTNTEEDSSGANTDAVTQPAYDGTSAVYVYTVDIQVDCTAEELFAFIEATNANPAIEMTTFNFKEPANVDEDGSAAIQLKIYVFFGTAN